jgi:hypothetical protein
LPADFYSSARQFLDTSCAGGITAGWQFYSSHTYAARWQLYPSLALALAVRDQNLDEAMRGIGPADEPD